MASSNRAERWPPIHRLLHFCRCPGPSSASGAAIGGPFCEKLYGWVMESQADWAHFSPMRHKWGQQGWEFELPFVHCPLSGGRLCGKNCFLPMFVLNPVLGGVSAPVTRAPVASNCGGSSPTGRSRLSRALWSPNSIIVDVGTVLGGVVRPRRRHGVNTKASWLVTKAKTWLTAPVPIRTGDRLPPPSS
jgi:hypothetical protein